MAAVIILEVLRYRDGLQQLNGLVLSSVRFDDSLLVRLTSDTASLEAFAAATALAYLADVLLHRSASYRLVSFATAIIFSMIVTAVLKAYVMEPRPHEPFVYYGVIGNLLNADYFGFPSGHTVRVTVLAYYALSEFKPRSRALRYLAYASVPYAALIMATRLLLQVHWISDIIGGILVGVWSSMVVEGLGRGVWISIYNHTFGLARPLRLRGAPEY